MVQTDGFKMLQDRLELVGRDGEVEKPVPARASLFVDLFQPLR